MIISTLVMVKFASLISWEERTRTFDLRIQIPMLYHLATPHLYNTISLLNARHCYCLAVLIKDEQCQAPAYQRIADF